MNVQHNRSHLVYLLPTGSPMFLYALWCLLTVCVKSLFACSPKKGSRFINQISPLSSPGEGLPLYKGCNRFSCRSPSGGFCAPSDWDNGSCSWGTPNTLFCPLHSPSPCQRNATWPWIHSHDTLVDWWSHDCIDKIYVYNITILYICNIFLI